MRFSIKDLLKDVEDYKIKRERYEKLLLQSKKKIHPLKFWEEPVDNIEIKIAYEEYITSMQKLESKYNPYYYNNLRKQILYGIYPISED